MSKTKEISIFEETPLDHNGDTVFIRARGRDFQEALLSAELVAVDTEQMTVWKRMLDDCDDYTVRQVMGTLSGAWMNEEARVLGDEQEEKEYLAYKC